MPESTGSVSCCGATLLGLMDGLASRSSAGVVWAMVPVGCAAGASVEGEDWGLCCSILRLDRLWGRLVWNRRSGGCDGAIFTTQLEVPAAAVGAPLVLEVVPLWRAAKSHLRGDVTWPVACRPAPAPSCVLSLFLAWCPRCHGERASGPGAGGGRIRATGRANVPDKRAAGAPIGALTTNR